MTDTQRDRTRPSPGPAARTVLDVRAQLGTTHEDATAAHSRRTAGSRQPRTSGLVWYASYGSNLNANRFLAYIAGGRPPGAHRHYSGCSDSSLPRDDVGIRNHGAQMFFALTSSVWGGGIAFLDPLAPTTSPGSRDETEPATTATPYAWGRAWLITTDQFAQVVAQENGLDADQAQPIDLTATVRHGTAQLGPGPYETLVHLGDIDNVPVVTFTSPFNLTSSGYGLPMLNAPTSAYQATIAAGLRETFALTDQQVAAYLSRCPGHTDARPAA